jgi:hypothetical protein
MVVAPDGRVVIANPNIAARISAMKTDPAPTGEPSNGRRCHQNTGCGTNSNSCLPPVGGPTLPV